MNTTQPISYSIDTLRGLKADLHRFGVGHLWLFGSRARGEVKPDSDWDVLVDFTRTPNFDDYMNLKLFLEEKLGTQVDVLSRNACKPRFLHAIQADLKDVA